MTERRFTPRHCIASLLIALGSLLALGSVPVLADSNMLTSPAVQPLTFTEPPAAFGSAGTGPSQFGAEAPNSVAVEEATGDVFALDPHNGRVEKFQRNAKGEYEFLSEFGSGTPSGSLESESKQVAVDNSSGPSKGDVYVAEESRGEIEKFAPKSGKPNEYEWMYQLPAETVEGVAVNAKGEVYAVGRFISELLRFGPEGEALASIPLGFYFSVGLAIAPNGDLYIESYPEGFGHASALKLAIGPEGGIEASSVLNPGRETRALAVAPGGDVYVAGSGTIEKYNSSGVLLEEFGAGQIGTSLGLAFAPTSTPGITGFLYVADSENHKVHVFEEPTPLQPTPAVSGCSVERPTPVSAKVTCAVTPNAATANVYVESQEIGSAAHSETSPQEITTTGPVTVEVKGLAPEKQYRYLLFAENANGTTEGEEGLFRQTPAERQLSTCTATEIGNESAVLHASFESLGSAPSHWHFLYGPELKQSTTEEEAEGGKTVDVEAKIEGLTPHTSYPCQLVASNEYGMAEGPTSEVTTSGPPLVESETFDKVGSINATLLAKYNPEGLGAPVEPRSLASTYYFEYGLATGSPSSYAFKTPEISIGQENGSIAAAAEVGELTPSTEYHFRVVITDAHGTTYGESKTFTTFTAHGSGLPDDRIYEMVTPPNNNNADVYSPDGPLSAEYADCGECEGYTATHRPFEAGVEGDTVTYVGDASVGGNGSIGAAEGNQYLAVRTAQGWLQHNITPPNGALEGPEYHAFSANLSVGVLTSEQFPIEQLSPEAPAGYGNIYRRVLSGFDYEPLFTEVPRGHLEAYEGRGLYFSGASADFSHILYSADAGLLPEASESGGLYEWVSGHLSLVDQLEGKTVWPAEFGYGGDLSNVMSANGSRVFWTDLVTGSLYLQENGSSNTLIAEGGEFWSASTDGSKVFYTKSGDLYEYNVETKQTSDLATKGEVQGLMGTSSDGAYIYFVADGVLWKPTAQEEREAKEAEEEIPQPVAGQPNLYLSHGGTTEFIATLSFGDGSRPAPHALGYERFGDWMRNLGVRTAEVAPDGQAVAFESSNKLTEYDNEGITEDYVYEAHSDKIFCASCKPTGEPPDTEIYEGGNGNYSRGETWLAVGGLQNPTIQGQSLTEDGTRVFFTSSEALVPHDINGVFDVYEWEQDGTGTCQELKGCVYILSSGVSSDGSYLIGTSTSGNDVFFETRSDLVPQDENEAVNLFDAAVSSKLPVEPQCSGTSCQGVPFAPTEFEAPSTVTFAGVGNFPAGTETTEPEPTVISKKCKKGNVEKSGKCVKKKVRKAKKAASKKAKKSNKRAKKHTRSARLRARGGVKKS